jgi:hypothetical protein
VKDNIIILKRIADTIVPLLERLLISVPIAHVEFLSRWPSGAESEGSRNEFRMAAPTAREDPPIECPGRVHPNLFVPAPTLTARPLVFFRRKRGAPAIVPERRRPRHGRPSPAHQRAPTGEVGERIGKGMKLGLRPIRCFRLFREYSNFPYIHRLRVFRIVLSIEDQLRKVLFHRRCNKSDDQFTNAHAPELSLER